MSAQLLRIELGLLIRDARLRWMALMLLALVVTTFAIALRDSMTFSTELAAVNQAERERWLGQHAKDPHAADHFGLWVFKPFSPLGVLEPGIDPYVGRMVRIEAHLFNDAVFRAVQDSTPLTRGGGGTVADIVQLVVPLLVMLLGYAVFAADRERGTLRLALGNGASPTQWLAARCIALLLVVSALVALPLLALAATAAALLPVQDAQAWPRLQLWLFAQALYCAIFLGLSIVLSLLASTARSALALSLATWVALCVLLPRLLTMGVEFIEPTPSYQATREAINNESKAFNSAERDAQREREFLAAKGVASVDALDVDLRGSMMRVRERHNFEVFDRHFGEFFGRLQRQDQLYGLFGALSPKLALQSVSETFAGTDYANHIRFVWAAEHYRRALSETMIQALIDNPQHDGPRYVGDKALWERVPAFHYSPVNALDALRAAAAPLLLLLGWFAAVIALAFALVRRVRL